MFFCDPAKYAAGLGLVNLSDEALIEIRAVYGGLELALGMSLWYFLRTKQEIVAAYLSLVTFIGFAGGRIIGMSVHGLLGYHHFYLLLEIFLGLLSYLALKQIKSYEAKS